MLMNGNKKLKMKWKIFIYLKKNTRIYRRAKMYVCYDSWKDDNNTDNTIITMV